MRPTAYQKREAGIELLRVADGFKKFRPELNDKAALKLAIMANPLLGDLYTGTAVRRDGIESVKNFIANGGSLPKELVER